MNKEERRYCRRVDIVFCVAKGEESILWGEEYSLV